MWRLSWLMFRSVSGAWFRMNRRFTSAGLIALGTLVFAGALGVDTNQTLAYQIFSFLAAMLAVSLAGAALLRPRFSAQRILPKTITAGQAFDYRVRVKNLSGKPMDGLTLLETAADPRPTFGEFRDRLRFPSYRGWWRLMNANEVVHLDQVPVGALAAQGETEVHMRGRAWRRGVLRLEATTVARAEPFGLARAFATLPAPAKVVVLPRRYQLAPLALGGNRRYQHGGVTLASSVGESEEFIGLRDYRPGDPLQRIHWKSFARVGKPVVREYQDEYFERHALVLDTFTGARGKQSKKDLATDLAFEEAVSIAASFACTLDTQDCLLDLLFVGAETYCYTAGRGQFSTEHLVEVLAGVRACADKSFAHLADAVMGRGAALTGCLLILLAWDEPRQSFVRKLRSRGVPLIALLVSAEEIDPVPAWLHVLHPGKIQEGLVAL
jgi:uncharacterized protein (DUF58 family)